MKRSLLAFTLVLLFLTVLSVVSVSAPNHWSVIENDTVLKATPALDGELDKAYESSLKVKLGPPVYDGVASDVKSTVYALYDEGYIYVFFEVYNDEKILSVGDYYLAAHRHPSDNDSVELRIGDKLSGKLPDYIGDNKDHHLIIADAYNVRCTAYQDTLEYYTARLKSVSKIVSENSYNIEMRIPLKEAFEEGDIIQFNFQVNDLQNVDTHETGHIGLGATYMSLTDFKIGGDAGYEIIENNIDRIFFSPPKKTTYYLDKGGINPDGLSFIVYYKDGTSYDATNEIGFSKLLFDKTGYMCIKAMWKDFEIPFRINVNYERGEENGYVWELHSGGALSVSVYKHYPETKAFIPDFSEESPAPWSKYASIIKTVIIHSSSETVDIGDYSFEGLGYLNKVTIDANVVSIGEKAFAKCHSLTSLELDENVTEIADTAFDKCRDLIITAPEGSYAYNYAMEHGISEFEPEPEPEPEPKPEPEPEPEPEPQPETEPEPEPEPKQKYSTWLYITVIVIVCILWIITFVLRRR